MRVGVGKKMNGSDTLVSSACLEESFYIKKEWDPDIHGKETN